MPINQTMSLPDIVSESSSHISESINHVGMNAIECPILWVENNKQYTLPALCNIGINLTNPHKKGIHMSRLYHVLIKHLETYPVTLHTLTSLLNKTLTTHPKDSSAATIELSFNYLLKKSALNSNLYGYRYYPCKLICKQTQGITTFIFSFSIKYSSTCPCSAALSRHAIQEKFQSEFTSSESIPRETVLEWLGKESNIAATPHAQRSKATLSLTITEAFPLELSPLILQSEDVLQTAVQTAVKREDEKQFAINNANNLMFCEDAVRKLSQWAHSLDHVTHYAIEAHHYESLHPHNAVAKIEKTIIPST